MSTRISIMRYGRRYGRRYGKRQYRRMALAFSIILTALISIGLIGVRSGHAQSRQQPAYGGVKNALGGETHLLRCDDLVVTFNYLNSNNEPRGVLFTGGSSNSNINFLDFNQQTIPNGQAHCAQSGGCNYDYHQYGLGAPDLFSFTAGATDNRPATGRFFNTVRDTTVHFPLQLDTKNNPLLVALSGSSVSNNPPVAKLNWSTGQEINFVTGANSFIAAVADFNNDGYDDLLMAYSDTSHFPSNPKMRIATAVDVNDPSKGFTFGPEISTANQASIRQIAIGDFNGDGQPEIAYLSVDQDGTLGLHIFQVNPDTITISAASDLPLVRLGTVAVLQSLAITAGNFSAPYREQLVVGFTLQDGANVKLQVIDFDQNSGQPRIASTFDDTADQVPGLILKLKAGRLVWSSPYDQIAWMSSSLAGTKFGVLTVDPAALTVGFSTTATMIKDDFGALFVGRDIAIGNFDRFRQSTTDPTQSERDPSLQIAVVGVRIGFLPVLDGTAGIAVWNVSQDLTQLTKTSYQALPQTFFGGHIITEMSIAAGDLQGRSFRLGSGYKVTASLTQPNVLLSMPPMHVDYVAPKAGGDPTLLNLSFGPDGFNSGYEQSTSTDTTITDTQTTSSSFSGEEKLSVGFAIGEVDSRGDIQSGIETKTSFTAKQELKNRTDNINGAFNGMDQEISTETTINDVVWYTSKDYYLYAYRVIGKTICPSDKPNCQDSERIPLTLMISAADPTTSLNAQSATGLEWYQPPWEPGNLFSYPASIGQLKQYVPDLLLLTSGTTTFATDDANATLKTTWSNGRTTGQNTEGEKLFSEDVDISVEGKVGGEGFGLGVKASVGLDLNFGGSNGTSSLNETDTKFNSARGLTVNKTTVFADPFNYKYSFTPLIFGKIQPVGYTDPVNSSADLLSYGALRTAFTVNMQSNGGAFWSQSPYTQFPDVALNHPNRWTFTKVFTPPAGQQIPKNCVALAEAAMDCVSQTDRDPENPWVDSFHDMRGLFITNATNPPQQNPLMPSGSQLQTATAGDKVNLWARVYNYSFTAMPSSTRVKVRFYGMSLDQSNQPVMEGGGSFLIGEATLGAIPPFSSTPNAPLNWVLATTSFDTTGHENEHIAFWVVVWMEDNQGNMLSEVPGHGLTAKPGSDATSFEEIADLDQMVKNPLKQSATDPDMTSFSNNVGFYRGPFQVLPKGFTAVPAPPGTPPLTLEKVDVSGNKVAPEGSVIASASLRGGAQALFDVQVNFYDGDPAAGGHIFDTERVAYLPPLVRKLVNVRFNPQLCGSHRIFAVVAPGKAYTTSGQAAQTVQQDCPAPVCVSQACMRSAQYYLLNINRLPKGVVNVIGSGLLSQVSTSNTARMRLLLQGGTSAQQQLNQQYVTTQLNLLARAGNDQSPLGSNLLCYQLNFQPTELSSGVFLNPSMTIGEVLEQARLASLSNAVIDQRQIAAVLHMLNGDDPLGRCK